MNASQRRKLRRVGDPRGYLVKMNGFMMLHADEHPTLAGLHETGQIYFNAREEQLYVTLGGNWRPANDELDAKRKVQCYLASHDAQVRKEKP